MPLEFDDLPNYEVRYIEPDRILDTSVTLKINLENISVNTVMRGVGVREISGVVSDIRVLGSDVHSIVYEFVLRPWAWRATLRSGSRVWSGSVLDLLAEILRPYDEEIEWRIRNETGPGANPYRDLIRQAWETDWQFFLRLCEEFGYIVWFEHRDETHRLVIADSLRACLPHDMPFDALPYSPEGGNVNAERVTAFTYPRAVAVGTVTVHDHSYISPRQGFGSTPYIGEYNGPHGSANYQYEIYTQADFAQPKTRYDMPDAGDKWQDDAKHLARVKFESMQCAKRIARGNGPLRGLQSGKTFVLSRYPDREANRPYAVARIELDVRELPLKSGALPEVTTVCTFDVVPTDEPYRMPQVTPRPRLGAEYAVIVSPDEREIWIDEHNRVLIQFLWEREGPYDGSNSIWVRLASQWQGERMGVIAHARRGDAVLVTYVNGDPDRPLVSAFVPDINHKAPWALPANQALSGMRSRSLERGNQSNHLALDDTSGKLQAQLASDHGKSSISLGYNTRIDGNQGRQDARGEGIEARTDLWGVLRAAKGWLMTSFARESAAGKAKDMGETLSRLTEARGIHEELAQAAQRHRAQEATDNQGDVTRAIKEANAGLRGSKQGDFPEFENPDIVIASAANLHSTSEGSTHVASREHVALTGGGNIVLAAARSFLVSVQRSITLFAAKSITMVTPGRVRIESPSNQIDMLAQDDLTQTSTQGWIRLAALKGIELKVDGTTVHITREGVKVFTGGQYVVHAATHATDVPQSAPVQFPVTAESPGRLAAHHVLVENDGGFAVRNQPYRLTLDDGQVISGVTNDLGELQPVTSNGVAFGTIELMAQSDPASVIGITRVTISRDADLPPPATAQTPARTVQVGGQTVKTPQSGATSANQPPKYLSCDPDNFGLRSYRYLGTEREQPPSIHKREDVEYYIAKPYTAAVKKNLLSIDWKTLVDLPLSNTLQAILDAVSVPIASALKAGSFGLPDSAVPQLVIATPKMIESYKLHPTMTLAVFNASEWSMMIAQAFVERILSVAKRKVEADKANLPEVPVKALDGILCGLAKTIYHEARHCQQTFWIASLYKTFPNDYSQYVGMDFMFWAIMLDKQWEKASTTPFPNDARVKIGLHRMLLFYYWWRVVYQRDVPGWEPIKPDFDRIQQAICEMRGSTPEQAIKMAMHDPGYYTHYHEEDAYATEFAVNQYWETPTSTFVLNPGACTSSYESHLREIGVKGNG